MNALRSRILPAIAVLLVVAVWVIFVKPARVATARPTVSDYLVRIARATGLEGRAGPRAPVDQYLPLLVERRIISADAAQGLRTDRHLTRDFTLRVASRIPGPPAPPFLSETYVAKAFLASHGAALGLVRNVDPATHDLFDAHAQPIGEICPTPCVGACCP